MEALLHRQYFKIVKSDREPNIPKTPKNSEYYFGHTNAHIEIANDIDEFDGCNFQEYIIKSDPEIAAHFTCDFWREVYQELNLNGCEANIGPYDGRLRVTKIANLDQIGEYLETSLNGYDEFKPTWRMIDGYKGCNKITGPKSLKEAVVSIIMLRTHYCDVFTMPLPTSTMSETQFNTWDELWAYAFYHCYADCPHCVTPYKISEKFEGKPSAVAVINNNSVRMTISERVPGEYYFTFSWTA